MVLQISPQNAQALLAHLERIALRLETAGTGGGKTHQTGFGHAQLESTATGVFRCESQALGQVGHGAFGGAQLDLTVEGHAGIGQAVEHR